MPEDFFVLASVTLHVFDIWAYLFSSEGRKERGTSTKKEKEGASANVTGGNRKRAIQGNTQGTTRGNFNARFYSLVDRTNIS